MPEFVSDQIDPVNNLPQTTQKQRTASDAAGLPRANNSISSEQLKTSQASTDRANDPISSEQQLSTSQASTEPAVDYHKATQATSSDLPVTQPEAAIVSRGTTREAEVYLL